MAVVLSCLDSRIPPEIIFDRGIGDLFVAPVAGNFENTDILQNRCTFSSTGFLRRDEVAWSRPDDDRRVDGQASTGASSCGIRPP